MIKHWAVLILTLCCVLGLAEVKPARAVNPVVPAFPGAMGSAAGAIGGRGGTVYRVSNLNDTGAGSLRSCIEAFGPRICIFDICGRITNFSRLQVSNPYIDIWGQTCPPGGGQIVLASASQSQCNGGSGGDCTTLFVSTHDVIVRYVTYDGSANTPTGPDTGTVCCEMASGNVYNVFWDHVTARWWGNKPFVSTANSGSTISNITGSWLLLLEPNINHPVGIALDATSGSAKSSCNQDFHHNWFQNYQHRWPLENIGCGHWVSNFSFNGGFDPEDFYHMAWGGIKEDLVGNKYVDGPNSVANTHVFLFQSAQCSADDPSNNCPPTGPGDNPGPPSIYMVGNVTHQCAATPQSCKQRTSVATSSGVNDAIQQSQCFQGWEGGENPKGSIPIAPCPASWFRSTPQPAETFPIIPENVDNLDLVLMPTVGNSQKLGCNGTWQPNRDSVDLRIMQQYASGQGGQMFNGQYTPPAIAPGTKCSIDPANNLPVAYEAANGIPAGTPSNVILPSGYTLMDLYGAGSGGTPPPATSCQSASTPVCAIGSTAAVVSASGANVRGTPVTGGGNGPLMGTQPQNAAGIIMSNPVPQSTAGKGWQVVNFGAAGSCNASGPYSATCGYVGNDNLAPSSTPPPPVASVSVSCTPTSIAINGLSTCTPTVLPANANQNVLWSSTAGLVSSAGVFTAPATAQTVTITAVSVTDQTKKGTAPISVTAPPPQNWPVVSYTITGSAPVTYVCNANSTGVYSCVKQ